MRKTILFGLGFLFFLCTSCVKEGDKNAPKVIEIDGNVTDIEGNVYKTVTIGTQTWMAENLKTTTYSDGTPITNVADGKAWSEMPIKGAYCTFNNDAANASKYGQLYNWYAVNSGNLAPTGWHVPTDDEWAVLENYLIANGYNYDGTKTYNLIAKSLASTTGWTSFTMEGTVGNNDFPDFRNVTNFTALPGGYRGANGSFRFSGDCGYWWSSSESSDIFAWYRGVGSGNNDLTRSNYEKNGAMSVRCLKD
jgi:uncharacterized protein (TIGR02145 family)